MAEMTLTIEPDYSEEEALLDLAGAEDTCSCGYECVWNGYAWEHDAAPWRWGDDHEPDCDTPTEEDDDADDGHAQAGAATGVAEQLGGVNA